MEKNEIIQFTQMQENITNIQETIERIETTNKEEHQAITKKIDSFIEAADNTYAPIWTANLLVFTMCIIGAFVLGAILKMTFEKSATKK